MKLTPLVAAAVAALSPCIRAASGANYVYVCSSPPAGWELPDKAHDVQVDPGGTTRVTFGLSRQ